MDKKILCNNIQIAYQEAGTGLPVVLLHGWGQNKEMMGQILNHLQQWFHVYAIDFPGFGRSDLPLTAYSVEDYTAVFKQFLDQLHIENPILIGHSFGCRIALLYASQYPVRKMVLTGAAGIKPKQTIKGKLRVKLYKLGKWYLNLTRQTKKLEALQCRSGSQDYQNAKGVMRPTLVKVVNHDITPYLSQVKCEVLLVFGENDTATPLAMAHQMEKQIPNCGLAIFDGDDHFAYWHQWQRFNAVLDAFLKEEKARS